MANSVVHFEIFATDVERARTFYERAFGWSFEAGGPPGMYFIFTGREEDFGLTRGLMAKRTRAMAEGSLNAFRCTISVRSIAESATAIEAAGGKLRSPITAIPGVGQVAEFADTDDNVACIMQYEPHLPFAAR
jgi:uncharacterized protein